MAKKNKVSECPEEIKMRFVVWLHILLILTCVVYSTYSLFKGDFEQALLPYPVLIIYYLVFARHKVRVSSPAETDDPNIG